MKKDILLICADHLRYDAFGFQNPFIQTPNLDALAANGTVLERAYCVSPVCPPARASLLTGTYPLSHGLREVGMALDENIQTLADDLRREGYHCILTGKSHLRPQTDLSQAGADLAHKLRRRITDSTYYGFEETHITEDLPDGEYTDFLKLYGISASEHPLPVSYTQTHWIALETIHTIQSQKAETPLFLYVSFPAPHPPCSPPYEYRSLYQDYLLSTHRLSVDENYRFLNNYGQEPFPGGGRHTDMSQEALSDFILNYYAEITLLDAEIGSILNALEKQGRLSNTLIIFTSDHGEYLGDHGLIFKGPWLYESLIRVPLIFCGPSLPKGKKRTSIAESVDLLPTITEMAGISQRPDIQGRSLIPVIRNDTPIRPCALISYDVFDLGLSLKCLVTSDYKLIFSGQDRTGLLFDLNRDPLEQHNLYLDPAYNGIRQELMELLCSRLCMGENFYPSKEAVW